MNGLEPALEGDDGALGAIPLRVDRRRGIGSGLGDWSDSVVWGGFVVWAGGRNGRGCHRYNRYNRYRGRWQLLQEFALRQLVGRADGHLRLDLAREVVNGLL